MRVVVGGITALVVLSLSVAAQTPEKAPVTYRVSFPAPEHRFAQVEVTFPQLPSTPLEARMSRSSPGRYALTNSPRTSTTCTRSTVRAGAGAEPGPDPYQWDVTGHDGTVRRDLQGLWRSRRRHLSRHRHDPRPHAICRPP